MPILKKKTKREDLKRYSILQLGKYALRLLLDHHMPQRELNLQSEMMEFARALPNVAAAIPDLIVKEQDWNGAEENGCQAGKNIIS